MHLVKRSLVTIVGGALLLAGVCMMVLPGPGLLGIVAGLAVLATEYVWARRLVDGARVRAEEASRATVSSPTRVTGTVLSGVAFVAVGVAMLAVEDVPWPVLDRWADVVWSPVTGGIIGVSGLVVLGTTYVAWRSSRGEPTTYVRPGSGGARGGARDSGATRYESDPV